MYIFNHALKNLLRNKGRNILLAIIMVAILSCTAVAIIINSTSDGIIEDYKNKFGSEVFIQANQKKQDEMLASGKYNPADFNIPNEVYEKLAKSDHVKSAVMSCSYRGYSDTIKALDQKEDSHTDTGGMNVIGIGPNGNQISGGSKIPNLNILGGLTGSGAKEFENGTRKIVEGEFAEQDGETVISQEFAALNNLKVGDHMKIQNPNDTENTPALDLIVSGIYFDGSKSEDYGFTHPMLNRKNEIITTYNTLKAYNEKVKTDSDVIAIDAKYYLKNPDLANAFNQEAHAFGLSELYDVSVDAAGYNNIVKPVEGLKGISTTFMAVVLIFGGSILVLISVLATRERKYEIGVLRAMGMKKGKVALGLVFETLVLLMTSLVIGLGIGNLLAQPASNMLLQNQLEVQESMNQANSFTFTVGAQEQAVKLEKIDAFLTGDAVVLIACVALVLGIVSVSIGILYINRYEPRKILSERNG